MSHPLVALCEAVGITAPAHEDFGTWPSPVRNLTRLGAELGASIWLKDDSAASPLYGGNKTRKLELLFAEARARGATSVITIGAVGSNQLVATAVFARALGLAAHALVYPRPGMSTSSSASVSVSDVAKTLQAAASGAAFLPTELADVGSVLDDLLEDDPDAYVVPAGASTPLGNLALAAAAFELKAQIDAGLVPLPDEIFVAVGTGGTVAGLAVGCGLAGLPCRIVGVRVAGEDAVTRASLDRQILACSARVRAAGSRMPERPAEVSLVDDQLGRGYGEPSGEAAEAITRLAALEGLELDATYPGKAMAGLFASCRRAPGRTVLFWQTANAVPLPVVGDGIGASQLPPTLRAWLGLTA